MKVISAREYEGALRTISITDKQKLMLKAHFEAPNRSISYTQLAEAAGYEDHRAANSQYGQLAKEIGLEVDFQFFDSDSRPGEKFYGSAIGMPNSYTIGDFQLVMHHELAKAIVALRWF